MLANDAVIAVSCISVSGPRGSFLSERDRGRRIENPYIRQARIENQFNRQAAALSIKLSAR